MFYKLYYISIKRAKRILNLTLSKINILYHNKYRKTKY